jgi:hypothetical protein
VATSLDEIEGYLQEMGLRYALPDDDPDTALTAFVTQFYRAPDGSDQLFLVIRVEEEGRYLKVFAPDAFRIPAEHLDPFLRACAMIHYRTKLIQFEWDADAGLIPIVEFPLEDAQLTRRQLERCLRGLTALLDEYHDVLTEIARTGEVVVEHLDAPELARSSLEWEDLLETFPPSVLEAALERSRVRHGV